MIHRILAVAMLLLALVTPRFARADISAEQVRAAIERGTTYLKSQQNAAGTWTDHAGFVGGVTGLATLALLNAGVGPEDESVKRSLAYLRTLKPAQTYVVALQTMVFCAAQPKQDLLLIRRNVKWLESTQLASPARGGWSYPSPAAAGRADPSNSQFALLALFEAERAGVKVSQRTWQSALEYWKLLQNPDGSWGYGPGMPGTGSMTCAGVTSVIIAAGQLTAGDAQIVDGQVRCCGAQQVDQVIEKAMYWLERNFSVNINPTTVDRQRSRGNLLYYLYGLERVGRMTAQRFIGKHDWYREGSDMLIRAQDNLSGYWKGDGHAERSPVIGTCFSLLFLAKGRRPVVVAKLQHEPPGDWNHHRSDLANLVAHVEQLWHRDLTWQVVNSSAASVEDLLQAPVLFMSGRQAPEFTAEEKRKLRDYVDRGGFLFAEGCCQGSDFDRGFRQLMSEIFPEQEYKLRLLPPEHPIWRTEEPVNPDYLRPLWGIDVGCRTSVVFCPKDLSCYWELARITRRAQLPEKIRAEVDACLAIGANVLAYATNREVKFKNEFFTTAETAATDQFDRGKLYVARLQHPGGCNAAPGALPNLMRVAGEKLQMRVEPQPRELAISDPQMFRYHLVFMHGRHTFRLTPAERKQLRTYLERGGMLFADAICSSREFNEAFVREMAELFPEQKLERIPPSHPLFSTAFGGDDLSVVERREPQRGAADGPLKSVVRAGEPYLEGLKLGDRYAVIVSPYDLSCALENHESLECEGYTKKDAARISLNVLLYSFHQ